ncbi:hypothetical protein XO12_01115 [Marinitoga sp. 1154]|uniref:UvrD-helicase domain-containing protein n=1 Tax=Marinitoga sp. 1154 TaxID=1643335 RepID=UPI001585EB87|nr:UvrD-helicase domain-containing protein [Marinitoga sp. 1154]NUU98770.1 hypothetical protein [Marinitoga sp. 1154]
MKDDIKKCSNCGWDFYKNNKKDNIYSEYLKIINNTYFKNTNYENKKNYKLTEEQINIIKKAKVNNLIINAFAGTGKSTTLLNIAYNLSNKKFLYLAFNRSIKNEIEYKIKKAGIKNIKVLTTHGFAYYFVKKDLKIKKIGKELNTSEISSILGIDIYIADLLRIAFNDFCNSDIKEISNSTIEKIIENNPRLRIINEHKKYLKDKIEKIWYMYINGELEMTHNVYLKYFQLNIEKYLEKINFDYVLLDEAQDTNEVVLDIFKKLKGKKIIVGDPHQQIYTFRGSTNAMYKIRNDLNSEILYLTQSFRFNNSIAEKANIILKKFKGEENEIISFNYLNDTNIKNIAFVTRTNATLIKLIDKFKNHEIKLIRSPKEIFYLSLNIYYYIKYLRNQTYKEKITEKWFLKFKSLNDLREYAEDFEDYELISAINIAEEYNEEIFSLLDIAENKSKNSKSKIFLTTAHTSKGLEWDKVIVCHDFPDIIDLLKKEKYKTIEEFKTNYKEYIEKIIVGENIKFKHQYIIDEINLFYVAITRAKKDVIIKSNNKIFQIKSKEKL